MSTSELLERFLRYVKIDTQSSENSDSFPTTDKQLKLAGLLKEELEMAGIENVTITKWGYVLGSLKSNQTAPAPTIALLAHMDTSPDISGENVFPKIHKKYNGNDIVLSREKNIVLSVEENPYLLEKIGHTLITTDGTTLLGADDKAGIAEIMTVLSYLKDHPEFPRPNIRIVFTPDEEVGRGTEHITAEDIQADIGYTIDGSRLGEIEDETFCADAMDITIEGINVHPGYAREKMVNAVKIASRIIDQLPGETLSPETTENREGYVHPNSMTGNVERARIKFLIRDFEEGGLIEKEEMIQQIVDKVAMEFPKAVIQTEIIESYRNMKMVLEKHPEIVEKAVMAIKNASIDPIKSIIRGGTDGAKLSFMGLPTANLFAGGVNFHSKYEWISLEDMHKATEVILNLLKLWATDSYPA